MAESESTTINLHNPITITTKKFGVVKLPAGQGVKVPKELAEDAQRMDYEHQQYKENLHKKNVYEVDAGTIAMGGE